jgi:hypothetical protein
VLRLLKPMASTLEIAVRRCSHWFFQHCSDHACFEFFFLKAHLNHYTKIVLLFYLSQHLLIAIVSAS